MIKRITSIEELKKCPVPDWLKTWYSLGFNCTLMSNEDVAVFCTDDYKSVVIGEAERSPSFINVKVVWASFNPEDKQIGLQIYSELEKWGKAVGCRGMYFVATQSDVVGLMEKYKFTCVKTDTFVSKAFEGV